MKTFIDSLIKNSCYAELDSASQTHPSLTKGGGRKAAFTLVETLITLGIIGVVAAITIPQLVSNYKKHVTVNKLKYVYSLLKNAEQTAIIEHGDMTGWSFFNAWDGTIHPSLNTRVTDIYYFPYLKTAKCKYSANIKSESGTEFININNSKFVCLPNGIVLYGNTIFEGYLGSRVYVDLNGSKGPNIVGRDVFQFTINRPVYKSSNYNTSSYRVLPKCPVGISTCFAGPNHGAAGYYWEGDEETLLNYCKGGNTDEGNSCAYMIQQAGWKIPDNYPIKF